MSFINPLVSVSVYRLRRVRGYYLLAGVLGILAVAVLLLALFADLDLGAASLLLAAAVLAGLAGFFMFIVRSTRLELRSEGLRLTSLGLNVESPWANVERLGPSPLNPQHMAVIFRQPAPVFEGRVAEAFRSRGADRFLDLDDFISSPHDDQLLADIRRYAPHA